MWHCAYQVVIFKAGNVCRNRCRVSIEFIRYAYNSICRQLHLCVDIRRDVVRALRQINGGLAAGRVARFMIRLPVYHHSRSIAAGAVVEQPEHLLVAGQGKLVGIVAGMMAHGEHPVAIVAARVHCRMQIACHSRTVAAFLCRKLLYENVFQIGTHRFNHVVGAVFVSTVVNAFNLDAPAGLAVGVDARVDDERARRA